jgi:iron complex outermembrane receptor protein
LSRQILKTQNKNISRLIAHLKKGDNLMTIQQSSRLLLLSTTFGIVMGGAALAADNSSFEEIVITATKMGATRLQDTPLAVSAYSSADLDKTGAKDIRDLAGQTPNLVVAQNGPFAQIYIRGIGSNNSFAGSDPSSTVNIDGVYIARPAAVFNNFLDIERIEVLRGPQGTLYGRNSVGGTINIISRKPDNEFHVKAQGTVANYNLYRGEGYISGPIVKDKLFGSISAMRSKHDGYIKNIVASGNDRGSEDTWGVRAQLRATPTEKLEIIVRADYLKDKGNSIGNTVLLQSFTPVAGGPVDAVTQSIFGDWHKVALDTPSRSDRHVEGVSGEINYQVADNTTLKSLTAYRKSYLNYAIDSDASDLHRQETDQLEDQHQFSEELNLNGKFDRLKYVLGAYYIEEKIITNSDVLIFTTNRDSHLQPTVNTKAYAGYGQADYDVTDQFTLTAGIRYTDEKKHFDQFSNNTSLINGSVLAGFPKIYSKVGEYKAWTPKFGIQFKPMQDVMLYASITRGFKSGGFNFTSGNVLNGFNPEKLWAYEAGFKSEFADKRVRLNASAFYYDYKDLQVQAFITPGVTDITNAANATIKGFEAELLTKPVKGLDLGGTLTYLDATYKDFPAAPITGGTFDASGNTLNSAPKWSYTLFAQYNLDLGDKGTAFARTQFGYKSRQYFTVVNDNIQTTPSYGLLDASAGYTTPDSHWTIIAYGRNLTNKEYIVSSGSFTARPAGAPGDPRTFGVRASYSY